MLNIKSIVKNPEKKFYVDVMFEMMRTFIQEEHTKKKNLMVKFIHLYFLVLKYFLILQQWMLLIRK